MDKQPNMINNIDQQTTPDEEEISIKPRNEVEIEFYEQVFNLISHIIMDCKDKKEQLLLMKIIQKLIQNIVEKQNRQEDSEKFRRLKLSNPHIAKLFEIRQVYFFLSFIGFVEKAIEGELYLYLDESKINDQLVAILPYLNLLILNEDDALNYYCDQKEVISSNSNSNNIIMSDSNIQTERNINSINNNVPKTYYKKAGIVDILKASKDVRLGKTLILPENYDKTLHIEKVPNNNNSSISNNNNNEVNNPEVKKITIVNPYSQNKKKDVKTLLKETASIRRDNAMKASGLINSKSTNNFNNNDLFPYHPMQQLQPPSNNNNANSSQQPRERPREMSLRDLHYSNPDLQRESKVAEDIGKKCLDLTNEFRVKNNLPCLAWDDAVWKICYGHSKNMGDKKVPFGHDGFFERAKMMPFYSSLTCENVFMTIGQSQYGLAESAVNGWINSPGHRKNMLTGTTHCAIATYKAGYGEFYLTQIFVKKW